ncbi:MAG: FAD-binding oxidoreductase [Candidatus Melainabacteria bacterium]|nr:FAD-binding oxidoreductase [Candidatus Melainabacteria bacterium]
MTGLAQLTNIARSINSYAFAHGQLQCLELEITSARQLADILAKAKEENVYVFRGAPRNRPAKLTARLAPDKPVQAIFLNFDRMTRIIEHVKGDQVLSIETGTTIKAVNQYLSNHGQWLPVEYLRDSGTVADLLDSADGGFLEPFSGGVKHLVLGMELAITDGELIKTGGKIVKNVTGYDLGKIFTGSHSWLAVPYMVHLRLYSRPEKESCFLVSGAKPQDLIALANNLRGTGLPAYCMEVIDSRLLKHCASVQQKDTILCTEIGSIFHAANGNEVFLLVSTRGHKHVADEVARALRSAAAQTGLRVSDIPTALGNRIQRLSSEIFQESAIEFAELSMSTSGMIYFFETFWSRANKPVWTARPSMGRLRLGFTGGDSKEQLASMIGALNKFADTLNHDGLQPVMAAVPSEKSELTFQTLSSQTDGERALDDVSRRLKMEYDPKGILNPLVSFYQ